MTDIKSMLPEELEQYLLDLGQPKYRAKQLFSWLAGSTADFSGMTNLPRSLRETLEKTHISIPRAA